jgi:hypothetical protein
MMQVPVPQHLGSSLMVAPMGLNQVLAIGSSVIRDSAIIELHRRVSQSTMFGCSACDPLSPHAK